MPFEAAKALAAIFCYPIRYALTPMFGTEFPDMCIESGQDGFGHMVLDQSVIEHATSMARYYRSLEPLGDVIIGTERTSSAASSNSPVWRAEMPICPPIPLDEDRSRSFKWPRRNYADSIASTRGSSSEPYCMSPSSPDHNCFTPVNPPRSHASPTEEFLSHVANPGLRSLQGPGSERSETGIVPLSDSKLDGPPAPRFSSSARRSEHMPPSGAKYACSDTDGTSDSAENDSIDDEGDEDYQKPGSRGSTESDSSSDIDGRKKNPSRSAKAGFNPCQPVSNHFAQEVKAAHALIHLHMQEATAEDSDMEMHDESSCGPRHLIRSLDGARKRRRASV